MGTLTEFPITTVVHSALSNSELHECKDFKSSVTSGQLAVSNGSGGKTLLQASQLDKVSALGNTTGTMTINLANGSIFTATLTGDVTTTTFTNESNSPVAGNSFTLILTQDGTGSRTVTWPAEVKWSGGAPILSTGAADIDIFSFITPDSGTTWYGFTGGLNFA